MYVLKGFVSHAQFASNEPGINAQIGELSTQSLTYSKEKGFYVRPNLDHITLVSFLSARDTALISAEVDITDTETVVDRVLGISDWIYQNTLTSGQVYADELLQELIQTFDPSAENFECGEIVHDGTYWIPEWVSFKLKGMTEDNRIKLWFVDASFKSQYDEYQIVIVPPFTPLDFFFKTGAEVQALIEARDNTEFMDQVQAAKGNHPPTLVRADMYEYVNPLNTTHKVPTYWGILVYGLAGNNSDSIKDALQQYILANSTRVRADWLNLLPDVFRRTEFMVVPMWENYAIPNRELQAGIYSPVANLTSSLTLIKKVVASYPAAHIDAHASSVAHPYKSLSLLVVGGPENRDNMFGISNVFPDYIAVATTSIDWNRMNQITKDWSQLLNQMLLVAEEMGDYSDIPIGMTKTVRDGVLYLVKNYKNIHYLVAAKKSFPLPVTP